MIGLSLTGFNGRCLFITAHNKLSSYFICLLIDICVFLILFSGCDGKPKFVPLATDSGNEKVITDYRFGKITIGAKSYYDTDIIIFPDRVKYNWHELKTHLVSPETISDVTKANIKVLIIGTGAQGGVAVPKATVDYFESIGIKTYVMDTWKAVDLYNDSKKDTLAAVLHLNC